MIRVYNKETGRSLGAIAEKELQFLIDELEEESAGDSDYYIDAPTIAMLEEHGGSATLIALLRSAVGSEEGVEIQWSRTNEPRSDKAVEPTPRAHSAKPMREPWDEGIPEPSDDAPRDRPNERMETVKVFGTGLVGPSVGGVLSSETTFVVAQAVLKSAGIHFIASANVSFGYVPEEIRVRVEDADEARRLLAKLN